MPNPAETYRIQGRVVSAETGAGVESLRVEGWDRDLLFDDVVGSAPTDADGRWEMVFDASYFAELFFDRRPDLFFRVFDGDRLILDTRSSMTLTLEPGEHSVVLEVPAGAVVPEPESEPEPEEPEPPEWPELPELPEPSETAIRGRAILAPDLNPDLLIEAFTDAELTRPLGSGRAFAHGQFAIEPEPSEAVDQVWLRWTSGEVQGRSPKLQPFSPTLPIRLHVYRPWRGPATGRQRFHANVSSSSGRAAVGMPVALLEVTLTRCQVLGEAMTDGQGTASIRYDRKAQFEQRPDLWIVVFDRHGTPLLESADASVVLPGLLAHTRSLFARIAAAFRAQGLTGRALFGVSSEDLLYLAERSGLAPQDLAAYVIARMLAEALDLPAEALFALIGSGGTDIAEALRQAVAQDRVSPDLLERLETLLPRLLAALKRLAAGSDRGRGSLDAFLATRIDDADDRAELAGLILSHPMTGGDRAALDAALEAQGLASPETVFLLDLLSIAGVDAGLALALGKRFESGDLRDGGDLARLGAGGWQQALADSAPNDADPQAVRTHAALLDARAQALFPQAAFAGVLDQRSDTQGWAGWIRAWLDRFPDQTIDKPAPLPDPDVIDPDELAERAAVTAYKRVIDLTGDHPAAAALLDAGLTTAPAIAAQSLRRLEGRVGEAVGGNLALLKKTHANARKKTAALNAAASFLPVAPRPSLCACEHCKGLFGPTAYLFELLALFSRYDADDEHGGGTLFEHLYERRPDIAHTQLSCPNTNTEVPQIDLVNELLEDLILEPGGHSVAHELSQEECLPLSRQSQGTNAERRASPQNAPAPEVLDLLREPAWPWGLPYDHPRDLARSARERLIARPADLALAVWRYEGAPGGLPGTEPDRRLAKAMLDLDPDQERLILEGASTERAWGATIAGAVGGSGLTLALLAETAGVGLAGLEGLLDTAFVRGNAGDDLAIAPEDLCSNDNPPWLSGPADVLTAVLDRLHRFERLRRHLDWSVTDLDQALLWLGAGGDAADEPVLTEAQLEQLGLLRFLEQRLRVEPGDLLTLFRDPAADPLPTLRPRPMRSAFALQFGGDAAGAAGTDFALPPTGPDAHERAQTVAARIARAAGEPVSLVHLAFGAGLVGSAASIEDLLALPTAEVPTAYRQAVTATFRLSLWARRLRLEPAELLDLLALGQLAVLDTGATPGDRLHDALRLVDLAERIDDWPVDTAELRWLIGTHPRIRREQGPSASTIGAWLMTLRRDLAEARQGVKPLPAEPRAALRAVLSRLLVAIRPEGADPAATDAEAAELAAGLEWGAFFPERAAAAQARLSEQVRDWPGLGTLPTPADPVVLQTALEFLADGVDDWLTLWPAMARAESSPTSWMDKRDALVEQLRATVRARLADPGSEDSGELHRALVALASTAGITDAVPPELAGQLLDWATDWVETVPLHDGGADGTRRVQTALAGRAAALWPALAGIAKRMQAREVLLDWVSRTFAVSRATAETLLARLSDPDNPTRPVTDAVIDAAGGASERLAASVVSARYFAVSGSDTSARPLVERPESRLVFDWSARPPVPALAGKPFVVELETRVPAGQLTHADGSPLTLVIEADGEIQVEFRDGDAEPVELHNVAAGTQVQSHEVELRAPTGSQAMLRFRYRTPTTGGARLLRVLAPAGDEGLEEFQWPGLALAVERLHRAALALHDTRMPPEVWAGHLLDLNALAQGQPLAEWQRFFALAALTRRLRAQDAAPVLVGFLSGRETLRDDLPSALNLDDEELDGALALLGVSDPGADAVTLTGAVGLERVAEALGLADEARRLSLPATALLRWHSAGPEQVTTWALAALRTGLVQSEWLKLLAEVQDPVREHLRDAQLDYLVARDRAAGGGQLASREAISDWLLSDVQMSPCMQTSRIQFAYAAVQRYVQTAQAGLAPWFPRGEQEEDFAREWVSMRLYRLYEAQMRVLVHAENWIEPALRPMKTPAFERFEQTTRSGPVTLQLIEQGMRDYVAELAEIARLEPVAIVHHEDDVPRDRPLAFRDTELYGVHVFARTRAHPKRLYYRRRLPKPDARWTPWERIETDLQGTHYLALVAFGRLRLICADFAAARNHPADRCSRHNGDDSDWTATDSAALTDFEMTPSWVDREHGKWSSVHRGRPVPFRLSFPSPGKSVIFERALPDQFGDFARDIDATLRKVEVEIAFGAGDETMDPGSRLRVFLASADKDHPLGFLEGRRWRNDRIAWEAADIPGDFDVESVSRIRLEWDPNFRAGFGDDCTIEGINVTYTFSAEGRERFERIAITSGTQWDQPGAEATKRRPVSTVPSGFKFWSGGSLLTSNWGEDGQGTGFDAEQAWKIFEGSFPPPSLARHIPREEDFDIDWAVVPDSLDLADRLAIQVDGVRAESFRLRVFSVATSQQLAYRTRFRPTTAVLADISGAEEAWGSEWVAGKEICIATTTSTRAITAVQIYPDDAAMQEARPWWTPLGEHLGVKPRGQALISSNDGDAADGHYIYGDDEHLAVSPLPYHLVVERRGCLSSALHAKIVDERPVDERGSARTLFLERLDEEPPPELVVVTEVERRFPPLRMVGPPPRATGFRPGVASGGEGTAATTGAGAFPLVLIGGRTLAEIDRLARRLPTVGPDMVRLWQACPAPPEPGLWRFHSFWHPQAVGFRRLLESRGLPRLVRVENQLLDSGTDLGPERHRVDDFDDYGPPTRFVDTRYPRDVVDFTLTGAYAEYNWELFFDALLFAAQRCDEEGRYDDADEVFGLLLDRGRVAQAGVWERDATLYQTAPIRLGVAVEQALREGYATDLIDDGHLREDLLAQIERIRQNPYQPHLIARGWPPVYARALRIRFAEHLIGAGEADFRRAYAADNRAYLESASQRFDMAARVLGPVEERLAPAADDAAGCYMSLIYADRDASASGVGVLEPYLPAEILGETAALDKLAGAAAARHFCAPPNDRLNELRAQVAGNLLKLRSCKDIDGISRALSLYGRRIDPALLVRATAEGLDIDVLLGRLASAKPSLYFQALWQRAAHACERARAFEDAWLGAQERADSEEMALLQSEQEIRALEAQAKVADLRLQDARGLKAALERTVESAGIRVDHYGSRERENQREKTEGTNLEKAGSSDQDAADASAMASAMAMLPTVDVYANAGAQAAKPFYFARAGIRASARSGGGILVQLFRFMADVHRNDAAAARVQAALVGRQGSFDRRMDDWNLQKRLAMKDRQKAAQDVAGAEIRVQIAQLELDLQRQRIDDAKALRTFMRDKLTSKELHAWRANRMQQLRYQQHRIAYDLADQARAALIREHGLEETGPLSDPWDQSHHGIGAAAALLHELERMQQRYLETWRREQQRLKVYSLAERDPLAFLELIQRGETVFSITEADYDEDGAGDWFRRLRHVSLDIPAVRGPYQNITARLTQLRGEVRLRAHDGPDAGDYPRLSPDDARFRDDLTTGESIVTNTGVQDDGRLDQSQDGENPLPFAMNGAIASFRLELPIDQNHFDRQTVTDVLARLAISSRPGGDIAAEAAIKARRKGLADRPQPVMLPLHSAFSNAWHRFVDTLERDGAGELVLTFEQSHIPLRLQPAERIVQSNLYFAIPSDVELQADSALGELSKPPDLQPPIQEATDDPHLPPPIQRLKLSEPLALGRERSLRLVFDSSSSTAETSQRLRRGWLICWLQGAVA